LIWIKRTETQFDKRPIAEYHCGMLIEAIQTNRANSLRHLENTNSTAAEPHPKPI